MASRGRGLRRAFSAEFKVAAVERVRAQRALGIGLPEVARELDVRPDMLRAWVAQAEERGGQPPSEVFPGPGHLPSAEEEVRRLQRENHRLAQELEFLKKAAAYFAKESR